MKFYKTKKKKNDGKSDFTKDQKTSENVMKNTNNNNSKRLSIQLLKHPPLMKTKETNKSPIHIQILYKNY